MADWVSTTPQWKGRQFSGSEATGRPGDASPRTASDPYLVVFSGHVSPVRARLAPGLPRKGQSHPDDPWLMCTGVEVTSQEGPCVYIVTATYAAGGGSGSGEGSPLEEPPEVEGDFVVTREMVDFDADGKPLLNTAGDVLQREMDFYNPSIVVSRNSMSRPGWDYGGVVNSDACFGAAAGQILYVFQWRKIRQASFTYYKVRDTLLFRQDGWKARVLNQGLRVAVNVFTPPKHLVARDSAGRPVSQPVLLDDKGEQLPAGQPPVWIYVKQYREKPLGNLGINID